MRRLAERTAQVIVLSHNKQFLCRLWEGTDPTLRAALEVARDGAGSTIRAWDVSQDCITEHDRRHALLRPPVAGAAPNNRLVALARKRVASGKTVSGRVDLGGGSRSKNNNTQYPQTL